MDALLSLAVRLNLYSYYSIFAEKILGVFSNIFTTFPLKTQWFSTKTGKIGKEYSNLLFYKELFLQNIQDSVQKKEGFALLFVL